MPGAGKRQGGGIEQRPGYYTSREASALSSSAVEGSCTAVGTAADAGVEQHQGQGSDGVHHEPRGQGQGGAHHVHNEVELEEASTSVA